MLAAPKLVQHRPIGSYLIGNLGHGVPANKSHESGKPRSKMKGVAVHNAGRVNLDGKDLKFLLWNDDPDRLRRRCASVARPSGSPSSKHSSGFLRARPRSRSS